MDKQIIFLWKHGQPPENIAITQEDNEKCPSIVTVETPTFSFSFFLRDVSMEYPIFIPEYGVVVTEAEDTSV